uniref:ZU5 domain-containing protein n=1 Tax=Panagrolaimus sp. JU765 TaxID=591449 RepID=A0AC34QSL8_9BILA
MQNVESDADSLKGDYSTSAQYELRNQLYPQTATGSSSDYSKNLSTVEPLSRFPDDLSNLNLGNTNGSGNYGSNNRNGGFYSAFSKNLPHYSQNQTNYGSFGENFDPFLNRDERPRLPNGNNNQSFYDTTKQAGEFDSGLSTLPTFDDSRSRMSSSPYQMPIRHENISAQIAQNRNAFFQNVTKNSGREHSQTPESTADYRVAGLSADDKSTRSNYELPFADDKSLNLDTEPLSTATDSFQKRNQMPIRHENISAQIAQNRNAFFQNVTKNSGREHSQTPESTADYRVAGLSADDKSTRSNYELPFADDKSLNLDTEPLSTATDSFQKRNQVKEHVSGVVDWTGGVLTCPESGVELRVPENAIPFGTEQLMYVEVCEDGPQNPPLSKRENLMKSGVELRVPENAIPFGTEQLMYVEVCEDGPQNPPLSKRENLMSPLVVCGPQNLKFNVPVELRLPHNFTGDSTASNVILKAGQGSQWTNIELVQPPKTDSNNKFVSVFVKHF